MGCFDKTLLLWAGACVLLGGGIGYAVPSVADTLREAELSHISLPMALVMWLTSFPALLTVEFPALCRIKQWPKAVSLSIITKALVQPLLAFGLAFGFFKSLYTSAITSKGPQNEYVMGAVMLAAGPCTMKALGLTTLVDGNTAYAATQAATHFLLFIALYAPTVGLTSGILGAPLPWDALLLSLGVYVLAPGALALLVRQWLARRGGSALVHRVSRVLQPMAAVALLLMLILIFLFQASQGLYNWSHLFLSVVPLILHVSVVFFPLYGAMYYLRVSYDIAAPSALIAASNSFQISA